MSDDGEDEPPPSKKWGKGKTDPASWWPKGGKSPNPKGRPKGAKNQKTLYNEAFDEKIKVSLDGLNKTMSLRQVGYRQLARKSAAGEMKAIAMQIELDARFDPPDAAPPTAEASAADFVTFDRWLEMRKKFEVFKPKNDDE
jgi:hypothetical protein